MTTGTERPVLILGAGINGAAIARELVLNGLPVWIVEAHDIAFGATAKSSRLIHGGLRYLEYGDFRLVRESLAERSSLRQLAPQFVEPLRLHIPVSNRTGSLLRSATRFIGLARSPFWRRLALPGRRGRGLWLVRTGLWLYDRFARDADFPPASTVRLPAPGVPQVDRSKYRWLCAYTDAQMRYPERFVIALLEDARQAAKDTGVEFRILTRHRATLDGQVANVHSTSEPPSVEQVEPALVVNATGAWGDLTLNELAVPAPRLFGGTRGSHFVTYNEGFREALGRHGLYAEAPDGRLVFVLPFGEGVLVGTTDERFEGPPDEAVASNAELDYLLGMVNDLFPGAPLTREDVTMHYSGVRPLPFIEGTKTGAISRDHHVEVTDGGALTVLTLVGGKLTTCRLVGEQVSDLVLEKLGRARTADTRRRPTPGGEGPLDSDLLQSRCREIAGKTGFTREQVAEVWSLCGSRAAEILNQLAPGPDASLAGTQLPLRFVSWVISQEWVTTLDDLVERRLMLVYRRTLTREALTQLAACLVDAGLLATSQSHAVIAATIDRLRVFYGRAVTQHALRPRLSGDSVFGGSRNSD